MSVRTLPLAGVELNCPQYLLNSKINIIRL